MTAVIGTHKFVYDVWGDTVNTASRMEKYGEPGRVHLSAVTRSLLSDTFHFETRGGVLDIVDDIAQHISQAVATDGGLVRNSAAPRENAREVSRELVALSTFLRQDMAVSSRAASCRSLRRPSILIPKIPKHGLRYIASFAGPHRTAGN